MGGCWEMRLDHNQFEHVPAHTFLEWTMADVWISTEKSSFKAVFVLEDDD